MISIQYQFFFLEAETKLIIQDLINNGIINLTWSYILEFEISENPTSEIRESILEWKDIAKIKIFENDSILTKAKNCFHSGSELKILFI